MKDKNKMKPWKGALPQTKDLVKLSLGDSWVTDIRAATHSVNQRSLDNFLEFTSKELVDGNPIGEVCSS